MCSITWPEERPLGLVGHGQAEELAARPQPRLPRDEATHPVLRRVLVGADHDAQLRVLAERRGERAGVARAQAPQRDAVALESLRHRQAGHWRARSTRAGTLRSDAPPGRPRRRARRRLRRPRAPGRRRAVGRVQGRDRLGLLPEVPAHRPSRAAEGPRAQRRRPDAAQRRRDRRDQGRATATPRPRSASAPPTPRWPTPAARSGSSTKARRAATSPPSTRWSAGTLGPGETKELIWKLVATKAGSYTIDYRVSPGLTGRAHGRPGRHEAAPSRVTIDDEPVPARVGEDGKVERGARSR